ncbi:hypothetical protein LXL04_038346 [Taraxacum kok-saghyz]
MATMVNIWICELTKLREMIQVKNQKTKRHNLLVKSVSNQQQEEESRTRSTQPPSGLPEVAEKQVSEETIFWIMDRFAPCYQKAKSSNHLISQEHGPYHLTAGGNHEAHEASDARRRYLFVLAIYTYIDMLKMLDLNLDVVVPVDDSGYKRDRIEFETENNVLEDRQSEIYSGTSVSSDVLNADDDPPVTNAADADDEGSVSCTASNIDKLSYHFGFADRSGKVKELSNGVSGRIITRQFFPVDGDLELEDEELVSHSAPRNLQVLPPSQQAKKSRRGPRSRSSQYRGVTFYRRTLLNSGGEMDEVY